jgi:hypothetical protein
MIATVEAGQFSQTVDICSFPNVRFIYLTKTVFTEVVFLWFCMAVKLGLSLRENNRLRVFENRVLRRIFGPKRDEVTGEWRKLHNEELHIVYSSPDIIRLVKSRRMRWEGHVARIEEEMNVYRVLMGKSQGKRPLGRPRCRWEHRIRM